MSKTNSKSLGNEYEREVAKVLSKWILGHDDRLLFWRNVHSGSISTIMNKKGKDGSNTSGDFQCLDLEYNYVLDNLHIDSKSYAKVNLFFINEKNIKSNQIFKQWEKTVSEAKEVNKIPMMPVKIRDRVTPEFVLLPYSTYLNDINYIQYKLKDNMDNACTLVLLSDLLTIDFKEFFNTVTKF